MKADYVHVTKKCIHYALNSVFFRWRPTGIFIFFCDALATCEGKLKLELYLLLFIFMLNTLC